ncbi:MAG TPA: ABC-type transport auxiliary lipoprotein family protein [Rhizomicrobium sp.]
MSTTPTLNRRHLLASAGALIFASGCSGIVGPPAAPQLYVLKPTLVPLDDAPSVTWALEVGGPDSLDSLDTERIALTRSTTTMDYYANASWTGRVPVLLQGLLVEAFEESGKIASVASDTAELHSDFTLETDIRDFEARYDTPDGPPKVIVRVEAKLFRKRSREIAASLNANQEVQAGGTNLDSIVMAFNEATGALLKQIVEWTLHTPAPSES